MLKKKVRSLNSNERFEEWTQEVEGCRWDLLLNREIWRSNKAEIGKRQQEHIFMVQVNSRTNMELEYWRKRINWADVGERLLPPLGVCGP